MGDLLRTNKEVSELFVKGCLERTAKNHFNRSPEELSQDALSKGHGSNFYSKGLILESGARSCSRFNSRAREEFNLSTKSSDSSDSDTPYARQKCSMGKPIGEGRTKYSAILRPLNTVVVDIEPYSGKVEHMFPA